MNLQKTAIICAGGTGGHIFPGLAIADGLKQQQWRVEWIGAPKSMEEKIVPKHGLQMHAVSFSGVRGKGAKSLLQLPWKLSNAIWQSVQILRQLKPTVVVGMGGYITIPVGIAARILKIPIFVHEQNSVAGMSNRVLAKLAQRVFTTFPNALLNGEWVGNPLRTTFKTQLPPEERYAGRTGPLRILVMGGSLGANILNRIVPAAIAQLPSHQRPVVMHQSGEKQIDELKKNYADAGVEATLLPFIDDVAVAMAQADLLIARAGASTVTEVAALGIATLFIPYPHAVDDHQTHNARYLVNAGAASICAQENFSTEFLLHVLQKTERNTLQSIATISRQMFKLDATEKIVKACEDLAS